MTDTDGYRGDTMQTSQSRYHQQPLWLGSLLPISDLLSTVIMMVLTHLQRCSAACPAAFPLGNDNSAIYRTLAQSDKIALSQQWLWENYWEQREEPGASLAFSILCCRGQAGQAVLFWSSGGYTCTVAWGLLPVWQQGCRWHFWSIPSSVCPTIPVFTSEKLCAVIG